MKKIVLFLVVSFIILPCRANEGMWFLMFIERLNHRDMQKMGLQLTAEEIYSVNNSSLKDAVVQFNGGCTAEIVSKEGLLFTNHHCGYDIIAALSTPETNYLKNGFWAANKEAELKPKSLSVRFFVRMDDVTQRILDRVKGVSIEAEREKIIAREIALIERENNENGKYVVSVRPFFKGNEYYYFVYQDYKDVRLVGTPPSSIGKFGGDTDNWEWPRHTGDFSIFRVYTDQKGNPAEYSPDNIPLKPKYYLPISLKGHQENDFSMILGYPGKTNRWMPAMGVEQNIKYAYPAWVESSKLGMDVMKKYMDKNDQVRIDYASKYAYVANYWKNRQGMIDALTKHQTVKTKQVEEDKFNKWANLPQNKEMYGHVMEIITNYYAKTNEKARHDNYLAGLLRTSKFITIPNRLGNTLKNYAKQNEAGRREMLPQLNDEIDEFYNEIYLPLEKEMLIEQLKLYRSKASAGGTITYLQEATKNGTIDIKTYIESAFTTSIFASKEALANFIEEPSSDKVNEDPLHQLSSSILAKYKEKTGEQIQIDYDFQQAFRRMVNGMQHANPRTKYYPDANSTLRLTYGKVKSLPLDKRNDAKINNYTTLQGTIAKYKPNDDEFDLPTKLIELNTKKDFGQYADKAGFMPVNFLTDNDITGGNSGSPVLNGKGELTGIAFDGNIEAMAGDVIFDSELQRTINVDIRYILFIIDKFAGAKHIVDELTIVK